LNPFFCGESFFSAPGFKGFAQIFFSALAAFAVILLLPDYSDLLRFYVIDTTQVKLIIDKPMRGWRIAMESPEYRLSRYEDL
jgi:hypothetical protein